MHAWPSRSTTRNYPLLHHGRLEAATLVDTDGQLSWSPLISPHPSSELRFHIHSSTTVFPPTKPPPSPPPRATVKQRADHGAHFLRTHVPEVDIAANLIRDQIEQDAYEVAALSQFDSFEGNTLDIVTDYNKWTYLVFAMGELGSELNVSPILSADTGQATLRPTTTPIRTFSTPIQQITSPPVSAPDPSVHRDMLLGVRTFGSTSLLKLDTDSCSKPGLTDVVHFTSRDTGEASVVDFRISIPGSPFEVLLINKLGALYGSSIPNGKKTMQLHAGPGSSSDSFWRIGLGMRQTECTILSSDSLNQLDFRSNKINSVFSNSALSDILTSIEDYAQDGLVRLCSTSQIIWLDLRYPGKPLLGYKHHRHFDRTLHTTTLFFDNSPYTFLKTKRNRLISIYSVSRHVDKLIRVDDVPYGFCLPGTNNRYTAQTFWQQEPKSVYVFRADEQAKVDCIQLLRGGQVREPEACESLVVEASNAAVELERKCTDVETDLDKYGDQDRVITDLSLPYDNVFRIQAEQQRTVEEEQADEFYDVMEGLPTFWQTNDVPSEHMLTSHDIIFRSHEVPDNLSRSDFTAGSLWNSSRGYQALSHDKFPSEYLRNGVPWNLDISNIQRRIDPSLDLDSGVRGLAESLQSFDLLNDDDRTASSHRRENRAREQLTVDLTLSKDVYSHSAFTPPREIGNDLETMTEALSLGGDQVDEPPEAEFGHLRPVARAKAMDHYEKDKGEGTESGDSDKISLPMGVRLLLKDWEVGTKSKDYVFRDPYNTTDQPTPHFLAAAKLQHASSVPNALSQPVHSRRPPPVMSSQSVVADSGTLPLQKRPPLVVQSQDTFLRPRMPFQSSAAEFSQQTQPSQPSTQIVPGPHGGRPSTTKKKPGKKRVGGF